MRERESVCVCVCVLGAYCHGKQPMGPSLELYIEQILSR
jgi:hypothetical protein